MCAFGKLRKKIDSPVLGAPMNVKTFITVSVLQLRDRQEGSTVLNTKPSCMLEFPVLYTVVNSDVGLQPDGCTCVC